MKNLLKQHQPDNMNIDEIVLDESKLMLHLDYNDEELLLFAKEQQKVVATKVKHKYISGEELRNEYYSILPKEQFVVYDNIEFVDSLNNNGHNINPTATPSSRKQVYTHLSSVGRVSDIQNVSNCSRVTNPRKELNIPSTCITSGTIPLNFDGKSLAVPEKKSSETNKFHIRKFP
jgi:hypothetical protein